MSTSILKTHYRRGANVLISEQIKEIRCLKNKQNGNHFFEELRKVQSISSVLALENNLQEKENNHPISETLDQFHESIEMDVQKMQKTKKKLPKRWGLYQNSALDILHGIFASIEKDRIESEKAICESEKLLALNPPFHYIQTKIASQG
ncbi:21840_t:CDS:2, partial [Gigaspora margarita]